jgi:hypothetical protein
MLATKALFTSPVFLTPRDVEICGDLVFTQILSNPLKYSFKKYSTMMGSFYSSQKYTSMAGIYGDIPTLSHSNPASKDKNFLASLRASRRSFFSPDSPRSSDPKFVLIYILVKGILKYKPIFF